MLHRLHPIAYYSYIQEDNRMPTDCGRGFSVWVKRERLRQKIIIPASSTAYACSSGALDEPKKSSGKARLISSYSKFKQLLDTAPGRQASGCEVR